MSYEKAMKPARKRELIAEVREDYGISERRACRLMMVHRSTCQYTFRRKDDRALRLRLKELAYARPRYGYRRLTILRKREGWSVNRKRVHRIYREEGLMVRTKKRKKRAAQWRLKPLPTLCVGERWSIDFMSDRLAEGRRFQVCTVVDHVSRKCVAIEVELSLPAGVVTEALDRAIRTRRKPQTIILDTGTEFISHLFDRWAHGHGIGLGFISPGRAVENSLIESFNGRLRAESLNQHWFESVAEAREVIEGWRREYRERQPHASSGNRAPVHYIAELLGV